MKALSWVRRQWLDRDWPLYLSVVLVTSLLTVTSLELWRANITVPFTYKGDAIAVGSHFKTVIENGWYEFNPLLSAPYGQTYHDFPTADNLNFIWAKVLGWFISDWAVAMNVYFLIGFPLAAATAVWLFRVCGASKAVTLALTPLFAVAPYHFIRGEGHLFLASYYVIPLSVVLVIRAIRGEALWGWREGASGWRRWFGRGTGTAAIIALTGTAQTYYAVFFLLLLAFAGLVTLIRTRGWRRFWGAALTGVFTVVVMVINMIPDQIYAWVNGPNPGGLDRGHADAELYGLKLTQLLLPGAGHRIPALARLRELYDNSYPLPSEQPSLGVIAAGGLVALFIYLAYLAASGGRVKFGAAATRRRAALFAMVASLVFVAFLFSTIGGLSTPISFLTTALRGWNRMSIYIALLCLVAAAILLDGVIRWIVGRRKLAGRGRAVVAGVLAVVVLGVGYYDQTPGNIGDKYAATIDHFQSDARWFDRVQAEVGEGNMVLQLPYQSFPEDQGPTGVLGSETLIPYLHTHDIAWSGGGIKGRPRAEWPESIDRFEPDEIVELAAAAGMTGIHIDRDSLFPAQKQALESGLTELLGTPIESEDARYAYYSLAAATASLSDDHDAASIEEVGARVVNPITLNELSTFERGYGPDGDVISTVEQPDPAFMVNNDTDAPVSATLTLELRWVPGLGKKGPLEITLPDGSTETVQLTDKGVIKTWHLTVPAGVTSISFREPGQPAGSEPALQVLTRQIVDDTTADFLGR